MTLPTSRDITAAPGGTIPSSLLNDLQDAIIALNTQRLADEAQITAILAGRSNARTKILTPPWNNAAGWTLSAGGTTFPYADLAASTPGTLWIPIPTILGERLQSVVVVAAANGNGTVCVVTDVQASLRRVNAASGGSTPGSSTTLIAATSLPSTAITMQKITLSAGGPFTLSADQAYYLLVSGANTPGAKQCIRVEYNYDVP